MSGNDQNRAGPGPPRDASTNYKVILVVAATRNNVIGRGGDMPWRMPSSLKQFRALTMGRPMIMGRKTYQAIGKPLDGRDTIIVTRDSAISVPGAHVVGSLQQAFQLARQLADARGTDEIIIAGGGEIYAMALPYATDVHLDRIDTDLVGDTLFPTLDPHEWREVSRALLQPRPGDEFSANAVHFRRISTARPLDCA